MSVEEFGQELVAKIEEALAKLEYAANASQEIAVSNISTFLKEFKSNSGGTLENSAENYRQISNVKSEIQKAILNQDFENGITDFVSSYKAIAKLQNDFYAQMEDGFSPSELNNEVQKIAISSTIDNLTESGIEANVVSKIEAALRNAVSTGAGYAQTVKSLTELMTNTDAGEGLLLKYVKTYSIDSINQYSRTYNAVVTMDLGFDWYAYSGSNIDTTREFCIHMTKKRFFHKSEVPVLLTGDIDGEQVETNSKTDLPLGMKAETNANNFITLAGGWNCGHQILGVSKLFVPADLVAKFG